MEKISIIIPAYNEEKRILKTLESYFEFFSNLEKKLNFEIFVVINGSKDKTCEILETFSKNKKKVNFVDLKRGGKGYAVLEGFRYFLNKKDEIIGFVDADMATEPAAFYDLYKKVGKYEGVIASRYLKGAVVDPKPSFWRIISSRIFSVLIRSLLFMPYRDTQCGAKIFKAYALRKVLPKLSFSKWAFDVDLLYNLRKEGYKIYEIPTVWKDREYSKINFLRSGPVMALSIIRLRLLNSKIKGMVRLYDHLIKISRKFVK